MDHKIPKARHIISSRKKTIVNRRKSAKPSLSSSAAIEYNSISYESMLKSFVILFVVSLVTTLCLAKFYDPDQERDLPALIASRNFIPETHHVVTTDGYILGLYRIVNPLTVKHPNLLKRPIIIQHGLLCSGVDFIINTPDEGFDPNLIEKKSQFNSNKVADNSLAVSSNLGFALANLGYDVWLANSRGNTYSTNHSVFKLTDPEFWDFSFDEMIEYDLPATLDYVLETTRRESVGYIGHSQGTLIMFGLLATMPKYTEKVKPFIAMGPVGVLDEIKGMPKFITTNPLVVAYMNNRLGPFLPQSKMIRWVADRLCFYPTRKLCSTAIAYFTGEDEPQLNVTREPVYLSHTPAGTSWRNLHHYSQVVVSKKVRKYDFGTSRNYQKYGKPEPPYYPFSDIKSKYIALIYGGNDYIATLRNVNLLREILPKPLLDDYLVPYPKWNHIDYMWAKDVGKLVHPRIIELLRQFDEEK